MLVAQPQQRAVKQARGRRERPQIAFGHPLLVGSRRLIGGRKIDDIHGHWYARQHIPLRHTVFFDKYRAQRIAALDDRLKRLPEETRVQAGLERKGGS